MTPEARQKLIDAFVAHGIPRDHATNIVNERGDQESFPSDEQQAEWDEWLAGKPEHVQRVARRFPPWEVYRLKTSGNVVVIHSYDEPEDAPTEVTLKVRVLRRYNPRIAFERTVFGIKPDDLEDFVPTVLLVSEHEPTKAIN